MSSHSIEIKPVLSKKDRKIFVTLLWDIFKDDPNWVPPLIMERMDIIDEKKNPYFLHADVRLWIAYKNGMPVGRISAQIDELVEPQHGVKTGHYGFFDCIDDQDVANALFDTACSWLKENGMKSSFKNNKINASITKSTFLNFVTPTTPSWNGHNASGWKKDIIAVNGFDERMQYGGQDRELGERLVNFGIKPIQIRYSTVCLHLDHPRGYATEKSINKNLAIRKETKTLNKKYTNFGINK